MRNRYSNFFLHWLHDVLPTLRPCFCHFYRALQMNDEETDAGGDFFIDFMKVVIALFFFVLFITVIGVVVWGLIA